MIKERSFLVIEAKEVRKVKEVILEWWLVTFRLWRCFLLTTTPSSKVEIVKWEGQGSRIAIFVNSLFKACPDCRLKRTNDSGLRRWRMVFGTIYKINAHLYSWHLCFSFLVFLFFMKVFLDAIASPSSYLCQWVSQSLIVSGVMLSHLRANFWSIGHWNAG